ncbi:MAG: helix-turn-helix transcriptional regulator [Actinobacteria bacterium]|nr:helix-turn-helix transcriptional regulator [Actinomycetota bacterium]
MATMGPTTTRAVENFAGNVLKLARIQKGLSQRQLAAAAGVPHTTISKIEAGTRQPSWPVLCRILAAADLEPRVRLEPYDDHDDR